MSHALFCKGQVFPDSFFLCMSAVVAIAGISMTFFYRRARAKKDIIIGMDCKRGQAFLALTFFIGGILAVAGILIAFLTLSYVDTGYGVAASFNAEAAATAGAEDALLQLDRNAAFSTAVSGPYTVSSASSTTATVTVTQNSPSAGLVAILSVATVSGHAKKISVVVSENAPTGQISIVSWTDIQ